MQCLISALFAMLVSVVLLLCTKKVYKFKNFVILALISIGTFLSPMFNPLMLGKLFNLPTQYSLLFQQFNLVLDPFSAFMGLITALLFILYLYKLLVNKTCRNNFHMPEIVMLVLFSVALSISVHNTLFFIIAFWILTSVLIVLSNKFSNISNGLNILGLNIFGVNTKFLLMSFFSLLIAFAILLLGVYSQNFNFDGFVVSLKDNIDLRNDIFCLIFAGFGIPFILSNNIIVNTKLETLNEHSEIFIINMLIAVFYLYCLLRFIIMGAVPFPLCYLFVFACLSIYTFRRLYTLIIANNINCILHNMLGIQNILVIFSVLTAVSGFICSNPLISILGYSAAFIFFINKISSSFVSESAEDKQDGLPISLFSYAGFPLTIGFWGWCFILGSIYVGIISANTFLKICSYIMAVLFLIIVLAQIYKVFVVLREHFYRNENEHKLYNFKNFNLLFDCLIILLGIFPQKVLNVVFVPVSMFVGGTNFYDTFKAIEGLVSYINIYILGFAGLIITYIVLKYFISMIRKHHSKV